MDASAGLAKLFTATYQRIKGRVLRSGLKFVEEDDQSPFLRRIMKAANLIVEGDHLRQMRELVVEEMRRAEVAGDRNKVEEYGAIHEDIRIALLGLKEKIKETKAVERLGARLVAEALEEEE